MKTWMEFINQPDAKPEYAGRVLISKEHYEAIQQDAIKNHCHACGASITEGSQECGVCGATDEDE